MSTPSNDVKTVLGEVGKQGWTESQGRSNHNITREDEAPQPIDAANNEQHRQRLLQAARILATGAIRAALNSRGGPGGRNDAAAVTA